MTINELIKMARRGIAKWCRQMPEDGDYGEPEIITDRWSGEGSTPQDGDYVVIMIFHNKKEGGDHA